MDRFHRRHLPHEIPEGVPFFVTWNLKGAMPAEVIARLQADQERLKRQPARSGESLRDRRIRESKILFGIADKILDLATTGPLHLKDPGAAKIVEDSMLFGVPGRYELYAWCVMPQSRPHITQTALEAREDHAGDERLHRPRN